jgi:type IV pilus assembly protein PilA
MFTRIKLRLVSEQGFTLIELLVVIVILGILVAIAVPAYLSFRGTAQDAAAKSNVRSAVPAAESYYMSNNQSYSGMTGAQLRTQAPGVGIHVLAGTNAGNASYCLQDTESNNTFYYTGGAGGNGTVAAGSCPAAYTIS